jgi:hypothetical protein
MTTPDPKAQDVSTPGQKNVQQGIEPFLQNLFTAATAGGGSGLFNPANNPFARMFSQQNPAMRAFNQSEGSLLDILGGNDFDQYAAAAQPLHQQNLQFGQGGLNATAPLASSSALATQGIDLTSRANLDFDMLMQQAWQNMTRDRISAAGVYGDLGQGASQAQYQGVINPTVAMMLGGMNYAQPQNIAVQRGGPLDYLLEFGKVGAAAYGASKGT